MSDEFFKIATNEINDDISQMEHILESCINDETIKLNAEKFQKHTHKIKGLAPMMGKEELGSISALLDEIFKKFIQGEHFDGIFEVLLATIPAMKDSVMDAKYDLGSITNQVKNILSKQ
jgi:HPt (histidine-containing phosphotransfer) domain-containing protein